MDITTKYSINEKVWDIGYDRRQETVPCPACDGSGHVTLSDGKPRNCPECYGRSTKIIWHDSKWQVRQSLTIGEVRVKISNIEPDDMFDNVGHYAEGFDTREVQYMCYETGIGSGTLHNEDTLFSSCEGAQADCDKRNEEKT